MSAHLIAMPEPAPQPSPNWIETRCGEILRDRLRQRRAWLLAHGEDASTERLAAEFFRSPSTINRQMRSAT